MVSRFSPLIRTLPVLGALVSALLLNPVLSTRGWAGDGSGGCDRLLSAASPRIWERTLELEIADRTLRVPEFEALRELCAEAGVRCWLFGGTAAGFAHYVKWDLQRHAGDGRFQEDRFDYDYTNIFRSTQDADLVIDGSVEQAKGIEGRLRELFPHFQGSKSAWEVRLLRTPRGEKEALLGNPDFLHQHTDSNSTGMIEVSLPPAGESVVRDLRDWSPAPGVAPIFLQDVAQGRLHYYFSEKHAETERFKRGKNPPILSVIRYLTKAFQYELEISPEDRAKIQEVIDAFEPAQDMKDPYVLEWIEKNGRKLFQHAVNLEYAWEQLEDLGLRERLIALKGYVDQAGSLAWWLNRKPLRSFEVGRGQGKTARELGVTIVAHETRDFLAYESITRAHTGEPNVFESRKGAPAENAVHGDGFYTAVGRKGARQTGFTIRFSVEPDAREGSDFKYVAQPGPNEPPYVVVFNKRAIRVIQESLNLGPLEYYELLLKNSLFDANDQGIQQKLKLRVGHLLAHLSEDDYLKILDLAEESMQQSASNSIGLGEILKLEIPARYAAASKKRAELELRLTALLESDDWRANALALHGIEGRIKAGGFDFDSIQRWIPKLISFLGHEQYSISSPALWILRKAPRLSAEHWDRLFEYLKLEGRDRTGLRGYVYFIAQDHIAGDPRLAEAIASRMIHEDHNQSQTIRSALVEHHKGNLEVALILAEQLRDPKPEYQYRYGMILEAIEGLGVKDERVLTAVLGMTSHPYKHVRGDAYEALEVCGNKDPRVIAALMQGLADPYDIARGKAVSALGAQAMDQPGMVDLFIHGMRTARKDDRSPWFRALLAHAPKTPRLMRVLMERIDPSEAVGIRSHGALWLGELGDPNLPALARLAELLLDEELSVRGHAARSLVNLMQRLPDGADEKKVLKRILVPGKPLDPKDPEFHDLRTYFRTRMMDPAVMVKDWWGRLTGN